MYVVLARPSKNAAGREPDNLRHIFRELRLAVFGRMCRLPIGLGSLSTCWRGRFPILRCRMSGIVSGILGRRGWRRAAVAPTAAAVFRPILGRGIVVFGLFGKTTGVASDPPGWTCVLYLRCKPRCQMRHFDGQPQGEFWQANRFCKRSGRPTREHATEKWGRWRHSGFRPDMSVRTRAGRCPPGKVKNDESQRIDQ